MDNHEFQQGEAASLDDLRSPRAIAFVKFLEGPETNESASLRELRHKDGADLVFFEIEVPVPQHPVADIRDTELICVIFRDGEPQVFSFREGFPRLPHQNLSKERGIRWLCLNPHSWNETKHRWTPSAFLENIRDWLIRASVGQLHAAGQPREPLFVNPMGHMIVESGLDLTSGATIQISGNTEHSPIILWAEPTSANTRPANGNYRIFSARLPDREHGFIERLPANLFELNELCIVQGFDLIETLAGQLRAIAPAGIIKNSTFAYKMLLLLQQTVLPGAGSGETTDEEWAFMMLQPDIQSIAEALGVSTSANGITAPIVPATPINRDSAKTLEMAPIAILRTLTAEGARIHNGISEIFPSVAVLGAGALGSKVMEGLARAGFENAVLIDNDRLLPHNTARHSLWGRSTGYFKSTELAQQLNYLLDWKASEGFRGIIGKFDSALSDEDVKSALEGAEVIFDFSASVAVARDLSRVESLPRIFSAFLAPGGNTLFIQFEDRERNSRLDWLEAITLRAIVDQAPLKTSYSANPGEVWYGGPCREVSTVLPNYKVSIFSAITSNLIKEAHSKTTPLCLAYALDPESMAVTPVEIPATVPLEVAREDWTIRFDQPLIEQLKTLRAERLPNETGGVLLGVFDRERKICSVVLATDSPPDSLSWPTAYIRGVVGLKDHVDQIATLTAGQMQYVGEWHSHPNGYSSEPSDVDREAITKLKSVLGREGLPAIAFIIGEEALPYVLFDQ